MQRFMRFFLYVALTLLCGVVFPGVAHAHQAGLSRGEYRLDGAMFTAEIVFARGDAALLMRGLDEDGNGAISADELRNAKTPLGRILTPKIVVRG